MKKLWIVVSLLLLFHSSPLAFCADTNIAAIVEKYMWYPTKLDASSMTETERAGFIAEFRKHLSSGSRRYREEAKSALVRLGDEQTMAELVKYVRESDDRGRIREAMGLLWNSKNPAVIPHVAELLYYPEEINVRGVALKKKYAFGEEPNVYCTRPWAAAMMISDLIGESAKFSPELKRWLGTTPQSLSMPFPLYWCIRQLWEENKEAFLRHDYAAVKPPKTVRLPEPSVTTNRVSQSRVAVTNAVPSP